MPSLHEHTPGDQLGVVVRVLLTDAARQDAARLGSPRILGPLLARPSSAHMEGSPITLILNKRSAMCDTLRPITSILKS